MLQLMKTWIKFQSEAIYMEAACMVLLVYIDDSQNEIKDGTFVTLVLKLFTLRRVRCFK